MTLPPSASTTEGPLWTFGELHAKAEAILIAQEISPESGRVRTVPDERTLRYYTTIGLLAGPTALKGRKAYYSRIHLAQIVAIKRLQALGMSLAQVQQELAGATSGELEAMAALPEPLPETVAPVAAAPARDFWREIAADRRPASAARRSGSWAELAPGVVILLPAGPALSAETFQILSQAAAPLAEALHRQGLDPSRNPIGGDLE
jgi:DNA-binding transcriptional MerR regulator